MHSIYVNWFDSNVPMPCAESGEGAGCDAEVRSFLTHNTSHNHFVHAGADGHGAMGGGHKMRDDPAHRVPMVALE